jgi:hypothetical protein
MSKSLITKGTKVHEGTTNKTFYCLILGFATEYSKSVRKFTST